MPAEKPKYEAALSEVLTSRPMAYRPELARVGGGVQAGVFLSQLLYWTPRAKDQDGWVWKSKPDWESETGMTESEIDRARRLLKARGLLKEKRAGVPATIHYWVNIDRLAELLADQASSTESAANDRPRDEKGRFVPVDEEERSHDSFPHSGEPVPQNVGNQIPTTWATGSPQSGELDSHDVGNQIPRTWGTSSPQNGRLSIDYTETTTEREEEAQFPLFEQAPEISKLTPPALPPSAPRAKQPAATPPQLSEIDILIGQVVRLYEQEIGSVPSMIVRQDIEDMVANQCQSLETWREAFIAMASNAKTPNWTYVKKVILDRKTSSTAKPQEKANGKNRTNGHRGNDKAPRGSNRGYTELTDDEADAANRAAAERLRQRGLLAREGH